jgi:predicted nucleic acid-binding protein
VKVVDASVVLEVLLQTPLAAAIEEHLFTSEQLHAPHLIDLEVAQVLRRFVFRGEVPTERGRAALADYADFPIRRYPHDFLLPRIWDLRDNLTAYDAAYVALAEALDATLLTHDRKLATTGGHLARIELL